MTKKKTAYLYLFITFLIWGSLYVISKYALAVIPPVTVLLGRYSLSVIILYFILKRKGFQPIKKTDWKYFIGIGTIGYFFSIACQLVGTSLLDASLSSLINAMNPVAIPLMAALFLKETISIRKIISILISVAGVFIILGLDGGSLNPLGIAASIASVLGWAVASVIIRKVSKKYDPVQISFTGMLIALCFNLPASALELMARPCSLTVPAVLSLIYLAAVCTALAHTLWNKSLQILDAGTCSMLYPLQPLTSAVMGVALLHEAVTFNFVIGALVISIGILIAVKE